MVAGRKIFFGTCQAESLCIIYNQLLRGDNEDPATYLSSNIPLSDSNFALVHEAELIFNQVFSFEQVATLPQTGLPATVVDFPYVSGGFLWPFATEEHVLRTFFAGPNVSPYDAEIGDAFLNRLIKQGIGPDEAVQQYLDLDLVNTARLARRTELFFQQQQARDDRTGIYTLDYIQANLSQSDLFLTRGHPGLGLLRHVACQVFERAGIASERTDRINHALIRVPEHLNQAAVHPAIAKYFGLSEIEGELRFEQFYGRYTFEECCDRYMRYEWNRPLVEGIHLADLADPDRALTSLVEGLRREPRAAAGHDALGRTLERRGRIEEALEAFEQACLLDRGQANFAINYSKALAKAGQYDRAENVLCDMVARYPGYPQLNLELSHLLAKREKLGPAVKYAAAAAQFSGRRIPILPHLGRLLMRAGECERAVEICREVVTLQPEDAPARHALAIALWRAGQLVDALGVATMAIKMSPGAASYRALAADILVDSKRYEEAVGFYLEAVCIMPSFRHAHLSLSHIFARLGKVEEAIEHAETALTLEPADGPLLVHLGNQLVRVARLDDAVSCYVDALRHQPYSANTHYLLSRVLLQQQKKQEALYAAMNAALLEPNNEDLRKHLDALPKLAWLDREVNAI